MSSWELTFQSQPESKGDVGSAPFDFPFPVGSKKPAECLWNGVAPTHSEHSTDVSIISRVIRPNSSECKVVITKVD